LHTASLKGEQFVPHCADPGTHIGIEGPIIGGDLQDLTGMHGFHRLTDAHNRHGTLQALTVKLDIRHGGSPHLLLAGGGAYGFHLVPRIDPRTRAADHVAQVREPEPGEYPGGGTRTIPAGADHDDGTFWVQLRAPLCQVREREADGPRDVAASIFPWLAHIDHLHVLALLKLVM
jgi:hypothetical protein